jgi:hypothetical protein
MVTARQSTDAVDMVRKVPGVEEAWVADRGYVIAIMQKRSSRMARLLDAAERHDLDGEIRLVPDFLNRGEERLAVHMEHKDRFE